MHCYTFSRKRCIGIDTSAVITSPSTINFLFGPRPNIVAILGKAFHRMAFPLKRLKDGLLVMKGNIRPAVAEG